MRLLFVFLALLAGCAESSQPAETPTPSTDDLSFDIYLVAYDTTVVEGKTIGCGDALVPVKQTSAGEDRPLTEALRALVQAQDASILVNTVRGLRIEDVTVEAGVATVQLGGTLSPGGVCDHPRIEEQLRETALQFAEVDSVVFYLNGDPLDAFLSQR